MLLVALFVLCQRCAVVACYNAQREGMHHRAPRRRDFIASSFGAASTLLRYPTAPGSIRANADESYQRIVPVEKVAEYIQRFCNSEFLTSVLDARSFLYRGLFSAQSEAVTQSDGLAAIVVRDEPYDLLDPETYQSKDAATYFQRLDEEMRRGIRPSNSHLGTTCPKEAAQWGMAASIWPLGEKGVDFAWIEGGGVFWPIDNANRRIVTTQSRGVKLAEALQGDAWEIMFRADRGFLAVPAELDGALRSYLKKAPIFTA
ncbi:hypothetical protein ACHAXT_000392 [Thalassiosira profunda]